MFNKKYLVAAAAMLAAPTAYVAYANTAVFDLRQEMGLFTGVLGENDLPSLMQRSGSPVITATPEGLHISGRSLNWHAVDLHRDSPTMPLQVGDVINVSGTVINAPAGTEMFIGPIEAPWALAASTDEIAANGDFSMSFTITEYYATAPQFTRFRILTNDTAESADFVISQLTVTRAGATVATPTAPAATGDVADALFQGAGQAVLAEGEAGWDLSLPSLHTLFADHFYVGNIYHGFNMQTARLNEPETRAAFLHHFNSVTAENFHKPQFIAGPSNRATRPTPEEFNFNHADRIIQFAIDNDLHLVGHTLFWHSQTPQWLFNGPTGQPATRAQAIDNMHFYVSTLAAHWTANGMIDYIDSWDVFNEAVVSGGGTWGGALTDWNAGDWRTQMRGGAGGESGWWDAFANGYDASAGEHPSDFIWYAFYFARQYFPNAVLYYNDYNEEIPAKRNAIGQMVEQINARWAAHPSYDGRLLIERIGMQSHFHLRGWTTNINNVRPAIERFVATGAGISITELDMTIGGFGSANPTADQIPALLQEQAATFARLFGYYLEFSDYIYRVTFWGMADHWTWRAVGHPVIFDNLFTAKPAFHAIVDTVTAFNAGSGVGVSAPAVATPVAVAAPAAPVAVAPISADFHYAFDLRAHLAGLSGVIEGDLPHPIQRAGGPLATVTDQGLLISERSENWHALDFLRDMEEAPLQVGDVITVTGTIFDAPEGTEMILGGAESPWSWANNMPVSGTMPFTLTLALDYYEMEHPQFTRFRIQTNSDGQYSDFVVEQITVRRAGPAPVVATTPAPEGLHVTIDGSVVDFAGQQPAIITGRTLVPVRAVFEALGFDVDWAPATQTVTLTRATDTLTVVIGQDDFDHNGEAVALDVPAQILAGSTLLPIRALVEAVGYNLDWDGATQAVIITTN